MEALYNNIGEDADVLSFTYGDVMVVKEQINAEWLICELGNHTGIVPANYVKTIRCFFVYTMIVIMIVIIIIVCVYNSCDKIAIDYLTKI